MSERLPLTFTCWNYDRTRALADGRVRPEGVDLRCLEIEPPESFYRMRQGEFHASEMSLSIYSRSVFEERRPFQAIPVFLSRMFRHSCIYVNVDAGIEQPSDLVGKRVGSPEYQMSAAVWTRGILADVYGVPLDSVTYYTGGMYEPGRREIGMELTADVEVIPIGDERTLSQMLEEGEIDAVYGPQPLGYPGPRIRRLFEDYPAAEREYLQRTGIFPIMHTVVIRQDVLDEHPWVARSLMKALEQAKALALEDLFEIGAVKTMLPWLVSYATDMRELFGADDWWPYGFDANREVLDTFLRYSHEQGLHPRRLQPEELFFPTTLKPSKT